MRVGFLLVAGGAGPALLRDMKVKFLRNTNCGSSAIWATRTDADGCQKNGIGMQCGFRLES
jgi:hypothetical protein